MDNLSVKDLRKLVKLYNLEVHIKASSKMKKDELKSSLLKHLEINEDGELKHKILTNTYKIEKGELKAVERKKKEEVKKEEVKKEEVKKEEVKEKTEKEKELEEALQTEKSLNNIIKDYKEVKEKYQKDSLKERFKYLTGLYQALSKKEYKFTITGKEKGNDINKKLEEENKKIKEQEKRLDEMKMMEKEDVNVKAKPKETTVLELIKMYEDNIEKMKDFRKKANKYKKDEDFKDFEELVKSNELDSIYKKLMGSGGKFSRTSDKGKLIEIQRKNRDDKSKYKSVIESLKKELEFNYDDIDTILVKDKNNDYILKELVRLYPKYPKYKGGLGNKEFYTKDEIKKEMVDAYNGIRKKDYKKISEYLLKKYPYGKSIYDVEKIIFLFRVYHHYESGKELGEILERAYSYLYDVKEEERKRIREEDRD